MVPTAAAETVTGPGDATRTDPAIRPAGREDLEAVLRLLAESGLPTVGVEASLPHFVVADTGGRIVGVAGLEVHGLDGVLRSVAVAPTLRRRGLGARLTDRTIEEARALGLLRLYLLTTTAVDYFPRHGFRRIDRDETSPTVRESVEFREACPSSAVAMILELA